MSYQVSGPSQGDRQSQGLQFGLQFIAVQPGSVEYARRVWPAARTAMNPGELAPLKLLIRGFSRPDAGQEMWSGRLALCSPDLSKQIHGAVRADYERRAAAWPPGIHQAADTAPDMPVRELSGIGPPVRDVLSCDFRTGGWLLILHAPSGSTSCPICSRKDTGTIWFLLDSQG